MLVYDKAYVDLKNEYLVPLTSYSVPYGHLKKNNIKDAILTRSTSITIVNEKEYVFHFDEDYLFKALLGDIELFYIRKLIHSGDTGFCNGEGLSANWNIVTHYYNAFFAASLMLRLCYRGNIFLDAIIRKQIEQMISYITGSIVRLDSNQFYEVSEENGKLVLKLTSATDNTHELVWNKMNDLIQEMIMLSRPKSDERLILSTIKKINSGLKSTFPSQLRNRVNYQTLYGLDYVDKKLFQVNQHLNWLQYLLSFSNTTDDNQIACYMYAYTKYIEFFCSNFIAEYYEIKGNENGILKNINANRTSKIPKEHPIFVFQ